MAKKDSIWSQTLAWYPRPHYINFTFNCRFLSSRRKYLPLVIRVQILGKTLPFQLENCLWRFVLRQFHRETSQIEYNKKNKEINTMPKTLTFCNRTATATSMRLTKMSVWLVYFRGFVYEMSIQYLKNVISTVFNEDDNQKKGKKSGIVLILSWLFFFIYRSFWYSHWCSG